MDEKIVMTRRDLERIKVEAQIKELEELLHEGVCEIMIGWSDKCEVQGKDCPKLRKRLAILRSKLAKGKV